MATRSEMVLEEGGEEYKVTWALARVAALEVRMMRERCMVSSLFGCESATDLKRRYGLMST